MMKPRISRWIAGLGLGVILSVFVGAAETAVSFQTVSFDAACTAAKADGKVVVIDFYTTWCEPCKRLDKETWTDADVGKLLNEKAISLKLDAEKEGKDLARRYEVKAYPSIMVLKPDGTELDRLVGFREPAMFVREFQSALQGKNALKRAREAVAAAAQSVPQEEVKARQQLARELARNGDHEKALAEYVWLYEVGMKNTRNYSAVRTSFLTGEMGRLAKAYPPAEVVVRGFRDDAEKRLLGDISDREAPTEYAALNDALGENDATLKMFRQLPANDPRRAVLGSRIFLKLVQEKAYQEAMTVKTYAEMVRRFEQMTPANSTLPEASLARIKQSVAQLTLIDVEALAGVGDTEHAKELLARALALDSSPETKDRAVKGLERVGHPELLKP